MMSYQRRRKDRHQSPTKEEEVSDSLFKHAALHKSNTFVALRYELRRQVTLVIEQSKKELMKSTIKWVDNVQFVAETGSGHAVVIDGAPENGGRNTGPRPMELVLAGAATCTAFDVVLMLNKSRQKFTSFHVDAEAERAEVDPKVFTTITLTFKLAGKGLDPAAVERAVKLSKEKYCSATAMLGMTAKITTEIVISEA